MNEYDKRKYRGDLESIQIIKDRYIGNYRGDLESTQIEDKKNKYHHTSTHLQNQRQSSAVFVQSLHFVGPKRAILVHAPSLTSSAFFAPTRGQKNDGLRPFPSLFLSPPVRRILVRPRHGGLPRSAAPPLHWGRGATDDGLTLEGCEPSVRGSFA